MTEREVIEKQEQNGNKEFYLMLIGSFAHAYGCGAFALARATGYKVLRKRRKTGEVLTCGFPVAKVDDVRRRVMEAGGMMEDLPDGKTWLLTGLDGTPDEAMVSQPAAPVNNGCPSRPYEVVADSSLLNMVAEGESQGDGGVSVAWLVDAVQGFNLSCATPIEAMLFIGTLQQKIKDGCQKNF